MNAPQPPTFKSKSFICPHCNTNSHQVWEALFRFTPSRGPVVAGSHMSGAVASKYASDENYMISRCYSCSREASWVHKRLVDPKASAFVSAHLDMPPDIVADFDEARQIAERSPRSAAALLRLSIEKICRHLKLPGKSINDDIAELVKLGLPSTTINAFDIVRVIGNEAVHPGVIDIRDDQELVQRLFSLVNFIIEKVIHEPKVIAELHKALPKEKLDGIEQRNAKATGGSE